MKVDEASSVFLSYCRSERQLSANTLAAYGQDASEFLAHFGGRNLDAISGPDIVAYSAHLTAERRLAPATVKRRLASLRSMFAWLVRTARLPTSPFEGTNVRIRIPDRLPRCLHSDDMAALVEAASGHGGTGGAVVTLLFSTGIRVGELASTNLGDVDVDRGSMRVVGKGNRERQVFLPPGHAGRQLAEYVRARKETLGDDAPLVGNADRRLTPGSLRSMVRTIGARAGIGRKVTPHMLRHTAATSLLEAGVDIRFVQRLLGHRSILTTQIYTHVGDEALRAAIAAADICGRLLRTQSRRAIDNC